MAKRIQDQKEEERVVSKSRPTVMNMSSYFIATSFSAASSPITSKNAGMPTAPGKADSKMTVDPNSFDAASTSQVRLKDAYLGGLMGKQRGDPSHQEEEDSEESDNPEAGTRYYKGKQVTVEPVAQNSEAWVQLHTEPVLQLTRKVKRIQKRHGTTTSKYLQTHPIIWKPSSPWSGNPWKTTWRSCERFECEFGNVVNVH